MRCMNCGLPLSPARTLTNCPRCGASLNALQGAQPQQQFEQSGWEGGMGPAGQQNNPNSWGQGMTPAPGSYSPFSQQSQGGLNANGNGWPGDRPQQSPLSPRRPYTPSSLNKMNPRLLFMVAGLFVFLAAMLLGLVFVIGSHSGGSTSSTASTSSHNSSGSTSNNTQATATQAATPTASSATPGASPTDTGTAYPGQQYIDGAQMAAGINQQTLQAVNPTTTFKVNSPMYVVFNLHPPSQGGAVCSYWYLGGNQVTSYPFPIKGSSHGSYTYATYGSAGQGYVELYWASTKSCSDKVLAQHVDFTVTA